MAKERIVVRLDDAIRFEREFLDAYQAVPRSRRQEWLRSILRAGIAFHKSALDAPMSQHAVELADTSPSAGAVSRERAPAHEHKSPPVDHSSAPSAPTAPRQDRAAVRVTEALPDGDQAQASDAPNASPRRSDVRGSPGKREASLLRGFLPESSATGAQS